MESDSSNSRTSAGGRGRRTRTHQVALDLDLVRTDLPTDGFHRIAVYLRHAGQPRCERTSSRARRCWPAACLLPAPEARGLSTFESRFSVDDPLAVPRPAPPLPDGSSLPDHRGWQLAAALLQSISQRSRRPETHGDERGRREAALTSTSVMPQCDMGCFLAGLR